MTTENIIRIAEDRFWAKVDKSGDCWQWLACGTQDGYGQFWFSGRMMRATHFAVLTEGADVPSGMCILHTCDNPGCVKPDHLFIGTIADNNRDRDRKGRAAVLTPKRARELQQLTTKARQKNGTFRIPHKRNR